MIGFYNVIKPTGMSSTQVVGKIKRIIQQKRVGHLGTLDSAASGVLPVAVGKATKFFDYFLNKDKVYYAIAEFGVETTTLDSEGEIIANNTKEISKKNIDDIINEFIGEIDQVPPVYSALKIGGVPAYKLARNGVNVKIKQRKTKIYSIECIEEIAKNIFSFRVHCSAGTYIRTLLSDMAKRLWCWAVAVPLLLFVPYCVQKTYANWLFSVLRTIHRKTSKNIRMLKFW